MEQQLSSRWTFFYKFILLVLVTGAMCCGAWRALDHPDEAPVPGGGMRAGQSWMIVLALAAVVAAVIWWTVAPLKRLVLSGDDLLISNYRTEIRVPLTAVEAISGPSATNPRRYTVTFAEPTEFGRSFTFMPPMVWSFNPWAEADEVGELRRAWAEAQSVASREQR